MLKASWIALLTVGTLVSAPGFGDDAEFSNTSAAQGLETLSTNVSFANLKYASQLQPRHQAHSMTRYNKRPWAIADFDSDNANVFARVSDVRSLSLLTVAETGRARLFIGVNERGVLGLHFSALPRHGVLHNPELLRMPYLESSKRASAIQQNGQESN